MVNGTTYEYLGGGIYKANQTREKVLDIRKTHSNFIDFASKNK